MFSMFLWLQLKRTFRHLPFLLAGAALLFALTGSIAYLSAQKLYGDAIIGRMVFGVVYPEKATAERIFIEALAGQATLEEMTIFRETSLEAGRQDLAAGRIQGLLILPGEFVAGIIRGDNTPARLVLNENQALQARLLQTLTEAGATTLSVSQEALYAAWEVYTEEGVSEADRQIMNEAINTRYLNLALGRDRAFSQQVISSTGTLDPLTYFMAAWMILFLLLMGMLEAFIMRPLGEGMRTRLAIEGIGTPWRVFTDWLRLFLVQLVLLGLIFLVWRHAARLLDLGWSFHLTMLGPLLLIAAAITGLILWVYAAAPDLLSGMLLLFALSFGLIFAAGGFIPTAFLPGILRQIQPLIPATGWIALMGNLLSGEPAAAPWLSATAWSLLLPALAMVADHRREIRRVGS